MANSEHWIDVSFEDEKTNERLEKALKSLQQMHNWTINYLNLYLLKNASTPKYRNIRGEANLYIKKEKLKRNTQRYSLEKATEQSFPYFSSKPKFDDNFKLIPVEPTTISEIQIKARKVWKRYLATGGGITTTYGTIYLEGDWKKTLREQADEIAVDLFPYLWHSIVLKKENDQWKIKFKYHSPDTKQGKQAEKELEKDYGTV